MEADALEWSAKFRMPAETARLRVLKQHRELRRLLTMALAEAGKVMSGEVESHEALRSLVSLIRDVFVKHLTDEEGLIVPILEADVPIGPQRVALLREEHRSQRAELDALCAWPEDGSDVELAVGFEKLVRVLLDDIAYEERELLVPDVIRDDQMVIDQSDG